MSLSRLLDAKMRRAISPTRPPREPHLTMIAAGRHISLMSSPRNIVRSGTPAQAPEVRSIAASWCHSRS